MNYNELIAIAPQQVCIPISAEDYQTVEQSVQASRYSNDNAAQTAYYNLLSLHLLRPWIAEILEIDVPKTWLPQTELPSVWDVVNGTILQVRNSRLVLIPNGDRPFDELSVPQEWVDHPDWCGDYYLAIDIDTEQHWLRVVGYTTHQVLKQGRFDDIDRTYNVDESDLTEDLDVLWLSQEFSTQATPVVSSLLELGTATAERLLAELGRVTLYSPRLDIPFMQWGALITHTTYRQALYRNRTASPISQAVSFAQRMVQRGWKYLEDLESDRLNPFLNLAASTKSTGGKPPDDSKMFKELLFTDATVWIQLSRTTSDRGIEIAVEGRLVHQQNSLGWELAILDAQGNLFMSSPQSIDALITLTPFTVQPDEAIALRVTVGTTPTIVEIPPDMDVLL